MGDQVAVITGGGRGIGRAICQRFGAAGAQVVAAARNETELYETHESIERDGGRCEIVAADVSSTDQVERLITQTKRRHGRIDVLVNNAGVAVKSLAREMTAVDFETMVRVNIAAVFYACRTVWPIMVEQGGGTIVNISSLAARDPFPGLGTYGATKAWVNSFTSALAAEGRGQGVRAFAVGPGAVWTKMLLATAPDFPQDQALDPEAIAATVFTLCSPAMAHSSGETIYVMK